MRVAGIGLLFALRFFLALAELSLSSANKIRLLQKQDEGVKAAEVVLRLTEQPGRYLPTLLVLTLACDTGSAALAATLVAKYFPFAAALATGAVTLLLFVYAEMIPKTFALNSPERVSMIVARPVGVITSLLYPLVYVFIQIANIFVRILGGRISREGPYLTEEEIKTMVSMGEEEGVIEEEEKEMIHSIFEFGDTIVREVMVPRIDMVAVEDNITLHDVLEVIIKAGHSRIPAYRDSVDNIVGVVYAKDILIEMNRHPEERRKIKTLLRPAIFVPESKRVSELLKELQKQKVHMAIVLDEYGGTAGLVTIEDLLEEIVGEIFDEYDLEEAMVEVVDDHTYRFDARADLGEAGELLGVEFPEDVAETIGGLVYNLLGHIPVKGESARFHNLLFTVQKVLGRRILKVLVDTRNQEVEASIER